MVFVGVLTQKTHSRFAVVQHTGPDFAQATGQLIAFLGQSIVDTGTDVSGCGKGVADVLFPFGGFVTAMPSATVNDHDCRAT